MWSTIFPGVQTHIHRPRLASYWNGHKKPCDLATATATKWVYHDWCFQNSNSFHWPEPPATLSPAKGKIDWPLAWTIGGRGTSPLSKRMAALLGTPRIEQNIEAGEVAGDIISSDRNQIKCRNSMIWSYYNAGSCIIVSWMNPISKTRVSLASRT